VYESAGRHKKRGKTAHIRIVEELYRKSAASIDETAVQVVESTEKTLSQKYEATANMLKLVYTEVKLNIPFWNHEDLVHLLTASYSSNLGVLHRTRQSAVKMAKFISDILHKKLIDHMCSAESQPYTIILDGTTDKKGKHFLIVYIRALEKNRPSGSEDTDIKLHRPVTYFYKLAKLCR
jgi:hypothetical protein